MSDQTLPTYVVETNPDKPTEVIIGFDVDEWETEDDLAVASLELRAPVRERHLNKPMTQAVLDGIRAEVYACLYDLYHRDVIHQHYSTKKWVHRDVAAKRRGEKQV